MTVINHSSDTCILSWYMYMDFWFSGKFFYLWNHYVMSDRELKKNVKCLFYSIYTYKNIFHWNWTFVVYRNDFMEKNVVVFKNALFSLYRDRGTYLTISVRKKEYHVSYLIQKFAKAKNERRYLKVPRE